MTAQRLVRGSKARIVAIICTVAFCVGFLVLFQNNQTQLDSIRKNYENCVQQQESLSTQLQVIVDYKTRLEKTLQTEKAEHKQTRTELESRINDEKSRRDKTSMEANLRFQSLQQHYKLLQTKHDDLKEKSDKSQLQYSEETDKLQAKIKELQEQIKQSLKDKEKSIEHLKTLYLKVIQEKDGLAEELRNTKTDRGKWESDLNHLKKLNIQLQREIDSNKQQHNNEETIKAPSFHTEDEPKLVTTNQKFARQVEVSSDVYQIRDKSNNPIINEVKDVPQVDSPNARFINEPEKVVLQKPAGPSKSTTKTSSLGNIGNARPLLLPTIIPTTRNNSKLDDTNVLPIPNLVPHKKLPPGVVPVPKRELNNNGDESPRVDKTEDKNQIPDDINLALPNRYRNNIIESEMAKERMKETKVENNKHVNNNLQEHELGIDPQDNAAMEVIDQPRNPAPDDPLNLMELNPDLNDKVQEVEPGQRDPVIQLLKKQHIDALRIADRNAENGAIRAPPGALYEGEGDYDKDGQKGDLQIEEAEGEEDDDVDDYNDGHLPARQKEPAVRN